MPPRRILKIYAFYPSAKDYCHVLLVPPEILHVWAEEAKRVDLPQAVEQVFHADIYFTMFGVLSATVLRLISPPSVRAPPSIREKQVSFPRYVRCKALLSFSHPPRAT